jgi:hypothetical protein
MYSMLHDWAASNFFTLAMFQDGVS